MIAPASVLTLKVEKPAAGGRMLARHEGQVVLVWGAIPGEEVVARVERVGKGVIFAETVDIRSPSSDRRPAIPDWRCGGNVFAHVEYARQLRLKGEIVQDAFGRIGRLPLSKVPDVIGSPENGYRMRARLHGRGSRLGFYREGSHELCDPGSTQQLAASTLEWIQSAEQTLRQHRLEGIAAIELAEDVSGEERACHLELHGGVTPGSFAVLSQGLVGLSAERADRAGVERLTGTPVLTDTIDVRDGVLTTLRRDVRAFFQSNRFLIERLVGHVTALVPPGPVLDLYAGVGLFGLSLAAAGAHAVTLVEGDPISNADLQGNAAAYGSRTRVVRQSVEDFLRSAKFSDDSTVIVDPPRTGVSKEALSGILRASPARLVYVSCDVPTLARDARALADGGYELSGLTGMDMFPNTAHVETIAVFNREL